MSNTFRMEDKNITMIRGDTLSFNVQYEGYTGDLDSAYLTCKRNLNDTENAFQKSLNDGISKVETGLYAVRVAPIDTRYLEAGKYFYDLQIGIGDDIFTILKGILEIEQDITV